jgi:hypothetical protein
MPHGIMNAAFVRTSLTTCDVFVLATAFINPEASVTPEQLFECVRPWFIDETTVWWRRFEMNFR